MMKVIVSLSFALACVVMTACSDNQENRVATGDREQILHLGNGDEPADIDPQVTTGMPEAHIQSALFEGLVSKDPQTLEVKPAVAESWEVSEDNRLYTFRIRADARWSNGDPITANDFVWSWRRALLPSLGNQYAYSLYVVENAEAFHKGQIDDFAEVGIKALDDHTLQIELHSPTPYFLQLLDHHSTYAVHPPTIEAFGAIDERGTAWTRPGNFVGNGPFTVKEWSPNKVFVVEKNPQYWDADNVRLQEIHFYPVQQSASEERMFRAGQLHVTDGELPPQKTEAYREENSELLYSYPYFATYFYRLNTTVPPLDDVRVRRALAMTINREQITDRVTRGGQLPAYNLTPPDTNGYTAEAEVPYDIERARQLLAEAGYPNGEGFPQLTILYNTMESHQRIAVTVQQMWKQALNIDITLENQDWKVFLSNQRTMNFQIARASWVGDYYDPNTFLEMFVTGGGNNETGWGNARYDELIALAARATDQQERYSYFQEAETILMEEVPILPVYTYARNYLVQPSVQNWPTNIMDHRTYKNIYLEPQSAE